MINVWVKIASAFISVFFFIKAEWTNVKNSNKRIKKNCFVIGLVRFGVKLKNEHERWNVIAEMRLYSNQIH